MRQTIIATCPFCHRPHTVRVSAFESVANAPPHPSTRSGQAAEAPPHVPPNFLATFLGSDVGLALGLGLITWSFTYIYDYSPAWAVGVGLGVGIGFPLIRLYLAQPRLIQEKPDVVRVDVQIDDRSEGGFTRSLDGFNPELVTWEDLVKLAAAPTFTREGASAAGLSQTKWHKCKSEFLRLRYCVPMPNNQNGYALTIRGRHLLAKIGTSTNNNKQQGS